MANKDDDRARRLAAALRENLKRRKAQAREIRAEDGGKDTSSRRKPGPMNTETKAKPGA
jgi:hypothetical protein